MRRFLLFVCLVLGFSALAEAQGKAQGFCENGGTTVVIPGTQGSGAQKFQQTFPSCTVTVYAAGTTNLSTIYSDNANTAKANPFAASTNGQWFFYAGNGNYDVKFSNGGIPAPFTLGGFTIGSTTMNCAAFAGANAGVQISNCMAALPASGGIADARNIVGAQTCTGAITAQANTTLLLGAVTLASSASCQIVVGAGITDFHVKGLGNGNGALGATIINHAAATCFVSQAANILSTGIWIEDLLINTTSTSSSAGGICVGTTGESYNPLVYRTEWIIRNVTVNGPGATNVGTVGVSLTETGRLLMERVHIIGYETDLIMAATTESTVESVTLDTSLNCLKHMAIPSFPNGAGSQDHFYSLTCHGPSVGTTGVGITENVSGNQYFGMYVESGVGMATSLISFGASALYNRFFGSRYDMTGGTLPTFMVFAAGASLNQFHGDNLNLNSGSTAITMGAPNIGVAASENIWFGADANTQKALTTPLSNQYALSMGPSAANNQGWNISSRVGIGKDPTSGIALDVNGATVVTGELTATGAEHLGGTFDIANGSPLTNIVLCDFVVTVSIPTSGTQLVGPLNPVSPACTGNVVPTVSQSWIVATVTEWNPGGVNPIATWYGSFSSAGAMYARGTNSSGATYAPAGTTHLRFILFNGILPETWWQWMLWCLAAGLASRKRRHYAV
jgi:hypothetical protein